MNIYFRLDSSVAIGSGHMMRCLTLADMLRERHCKVRFICRALPENFGFLAEQKGYELDWLSGDSTNDAADTIGIIRQNGLADWIIVDNYGLHFHWEKAVHDHCRKIMVIDDLANRRHFCDAILDQNYYLDCLTRYDALIPAGCAKFLGPQFALLRPEFFQLRRNLRPRDGEVRRLLVFFGGSDPGNETAKALSAIESLHLPHIEVDVVVGKMNPHRQQIKDKAKGMQGVRYYCQADNMAELMAGADLAVGAGGSATWERCFLGLPSLTMIIAENQAQLAHDIDAAGAAVNLGWAVDVSAGHLAAELRRLLASPAILREMSQVAMTMTKDIAANRDYLVNYIVNT